MANQTKTTVNGTPIADAGFQVYFNNTTDTLTEGMAVCYDWDNATLANRSVYVEKPSLNNAEHFAGIIAPGGGNTPGVAGWVKIIPYDGYVQRAVNVHTDENIVAGDILGLIPGEYVLGKWVYGPALFRATEAQDRTTTAGLVRGDFGPQITNPIMAANKRISFFTHCAGEVPVSAPAVANAVADAGGFLLTGTSSAITYVDSLTTSEAGAANLKGKGVLKLTPNTTNEASLTMNGEPFTLAAGCNLFMRVRLAVSNILADSQVMVGFSPTDTAPIGSLNADYLAFISATAAVNLDYVKDGTTGKVSVTSGHTLVADTFVELAVLVRHRVASTGGADIHIWYNQTETASPTETQSEIPDDESLTFFIASIAGTTADTVSVDYIEINNYDAAA